MDTVRIRRLCATLVGFAFLLPLLPGVLGLPFVGGTRCGNAPQYGEAECMGFSLGFLTLASVGVALTQSALPRLLRRQTAPKALGVGVGYLVFLSALVAR